MRFYHQEELNDCGLACLATLISHFHQQTVSPYYLKTLLPHEIRGGISFFDLITLAPQFGLKGVAYFCEPQLLAQQVPPFLINVQNRENLSHFVLFLKSDANTVHLWDPAQKHGHQQWEWKEFREIYLGQILLFHRVKRWRPKFPWEALATYLGANLSKLSLMILMSVATSYCWFFASFFLRGLQLWLNGEESLIPLCLRFGGYLVVGGLCYFGQICGAHRLQQGLWRSLLAVRLSKLRIDENNSHNQNYFWETLNHQHRTLNLIFLVIVKVSTLLSLLPVLVWIVSQSSFWVLFIALVFIGISVLIDRACFLSRSHHQDQENALRNKYFQAIAYYLHNFTTLKKRQYQKINQQQLLKDEQRYFAIEWKNYFFLALSEVHHQVVSRAFNLVFWLVIFASLAQGGRLSYDLLILSITMQTWLVLSIESLQGLLDCYYQRLCLYHLEALNVLHCQVLSMESANSFHPSTLELINFGVETPGHFYQLPILSFTLPLQIVGEPLLINSFYRACFQGKSSFLINGKPFDVQEENWMAIDSQALPLAGTVALNIFGIKEIQQTILDLVDIDYWLKKYRLNLFQEMDPSVFSLEQLQLINFLSVLFSESELYFLNQPLSGITREDSTRLWNLFWQLKSQKSAIIWGEINSEVVPRLSRFNLDDVV